MIYLKSSTYGFDTKINKLQEKLTRLNWGEVDIFGVLEKGNKAVYNHNGEFIEPFFNDKVYASLAFNVTNVNIESLGIASVDLICTTQDKVLYKLVDDLTLELRKWVKIGSIKYGLDALRSFDTKRYDTRKFECFSIELKVIFNKNE